MATNDKPGSNATLSRRSFIAGAASCSVLAGTTVSAAADANEIVKDQPVNITDPLDKVLMECGSEFGNVRKSD